MTRWWDAPEVRAIAEEVIETTPDHANLADASVHIEYLFRDEPRKGHGRTLLGHTSTVTGRNAYMATNGELAAFYVVEIAWPLWRSLTAAQQRALVDHELCHCDVSWDDDGNPKLGLRGHDVEEFAAIVRRHGFWQADVTRFSQAVAEQLTFAFESAAEFEDRLRARGDDEDDGGGSF